jgi:hypothetical protein
LSVELAEVKIAINLILKYCNPLTFAVWTPENDPPNGFVIEKSIYLLKLMGI